MLMQIYTTRGKCLIPPTPCLSLCAFVCLCMSLCVLYVFVCLCISLYVFVCLFVSLYVFVGLCMSMCVFVCLFVCSMCTMFVLFEDHLFPSAVCWLNQIFLQSKIWHFLVVSPQIMFTKFQHSFQINRKTDLWFD